MHWSWGRIRDSDMGRGAWKGTESEREETWHTTLHTHVTRSQWHTTLHAHVTRSQWHSLYMLWSWEKIWSGVFRPWRSWTAFWSLWLSWVARLFFSQHLALPRVISYMVWSFSSSPVTWSTLKWAPCQPFPSAGPGFPVPGFEGISVHVLTSRPHTGQKWSCGQTTRKVAHWSCYRLSCFSTNIN